MSSKQTGKWMFVYPSLSKKKVTYFWRYWPINPFKGYHLISIHIQHPPLFRPGANISHWRGILAVPQMQEAPVCVIARCDIGRKAPELPASHALVDVFLGRCRFTNPINLQYRSLTSWIYIMNHGKSTNPWKIHGKSMENPWENPWKIHGKSMENHSSSPCWISCYTADWIFHFPGFNGTKSLGTTTTALDLSLQIWLVTRVWPLSNPLQESTVNILFMYVYVVSQTTTSLRLCLLCEFVWNWKYFLDKEFSKSTIPSVKLFSKCVVLIWQTYLTEPMGSCPMSECPDW